MCGAASIGSESFAAKPRETDALALLATKPNKIARNPHSTYCTIETMSIEEGSQHTGLPKRQSTEHSSAVEPDTTTAQRSPELAILTSQTAWIIADNTERFAKAKRDAVTAGLTFALVRDVRGITGNQAPFVERKVQFLTEANAKLVQGFLSSNPDFPDVLLHDPAALLGEYPHTKPIDGSFTGWLAQKIEFKVVGVAAR
jgi:hypothetical protein